MPRRDAELELAGSFELPASSQRRSPRACPVGRRPERLRGGASRHRRPFDRRRLALRPGVEGARPRGGCERAARRSARDERAGQLRHRARALRRGAPLHGRRPRAGRTAGAGGARRARAQRALRVGAKRACARATARAHGQPARDRARPRHGARGGRPARAAFARGRRMRDPRARRRRAAADSRERQGRGRARRNSLPGLGPALRRRLPVAHVDGDRRRGGERALCRGRSGSRRRVPRVSRRSARRSRGHRPRGALALRRPAENVEGRGDRGAGGACREHVGRALERRALHVGRRRPRAELRDPREHRRRDRRRRPRVEHRPLERGRRAHHGRSRRRRARPHDRGRPPAQPLVRRRCSRAGSSPSSGAPRRCGSR